MPLKIVHCADLHIGVSFSHLGSDLSSVRSGEIRSAFSNIINYCKEKSVDALLICGDLFDSPNPSKKDCDFVRNALVSLSPIPAFIICGNHDYMCSNSPFLRENYFPDNVHIFPCFEHSFSLPGKDAVIHGISYNSTLIKPAFENCIFDTDKINIMCLHGDMISASDYNTIDRTVLANLPVNYAAFGHIHSGEIFENGGIRCAYSGTPEGHGFNDDGFTGFIYAEISKEESRLTPVSLSKRHYRNISLNVSAKTNEQIINEAKKLLNNTDLFRLSFTGESTTSEGLNLQLISDALRKDAFYIDFEDNTSIGFDFDVIESEISLRGEFLRRLRLICSSEEEFLLSAKAGLDALAGRTPDMEVQ